MATGAGPLRIEAARRNRERREAYPSPAIPSGRSMKRRKLRSCKRQRPAIDRTAVDRQLDLRVGIAGIAEMPPADHEMKRARDAAGPTPRSAGDRARCRRLRDAAGFRRQRPSLPREPSRHGEPVPVDAERPRPAQISGRCSTLHR